MTTKINIFWRFRRYILTHSAFHSAEHPVAEVVLGQHQFDDLGSCPDCKPAQKFQVTPQDVIVHPDYKIESMLKSGNEILLVRLPELVTTSLEDKQVRPIRRLNFYNFKYGITQGIRYPSI
jgi:hypothetical protein